MLVVPTPSRFVLHQSRSFFAAMARVKARDRLDRSDGNTLARRIDHELSAVQRVTQDELITCRARGRGDAECAVSVPLAIYLYRVDTSQPVRRPYLTIAS